MSQHEGPLSGYEQADLDVREGDTAAHLRQIEQWLASCDGGGPDEDVVVCSRATLVRNLADFPFLPMCTEQERRSICARVQGALNQSDAPFGLDIPAGAWLEGDAPKRLVEAGLLSDAFDAHVAGGLWVSKEAPGAWLAVNELDHLTLRSLASGLQPLELWERLNAVDDALARSLNPAFHADWGYLSPAIDRIGTGLSVCVLMHAPGMAMEGTLPELETGMREAQCDLAAWRGTLAKPQGALIALENAATIGRHEEELVHLVRQKAQELAVKEREARGRMQEGPLARVARDAVSRSAALAKHVRLLDYEEGLDLLSGLRLGVAMGWVEGTGFAAIDRLRVESQAGHVLCNADAHGPDEAESSSLEESESRANLFRKTFAEVAAVF